MNCHFDQISVQESGVEENIGTQYSIWQLKVCCAFFLLGDRSLTLLAF